MSNIEFLTVINDQGLIPQIKDLISQFQQQKRITVDTNFVGWDSIWRELVNVGIYRRGPDIVEVGTTWLESLVGMNTLRPFSSSEIDQFGGKSAFIPATWTSTTLSGDNQVWGIPVRCDVRVIWYWKDMFEQAKVDPATAFSDIHSTQESLEKLKTVIETPWAVTTAQSDPNIIQSLATWIWAMNSDFVSEDCKKVLLMEHASLDALRAYFGLHRYMPKDSLDLTGGNLANLFANRRVAAILAGPWILTNDQGLSTDALSRIGITHTPGPAFVGGTVLCVCQHSRRTNEVLNFIKFLMQPEVQVTFGPPVGLLPTRNDAWKLPSLANDPLYKMIYEAFQNGRGLPAVSLWGMVEEKLKVGFSMIWKELLTSPDADVEQTIHKYLGPTVSRLNLSLQ